MQDLTGQVAWVTGAGTGIGESGAIKLAAAGCKVVLSGRRAEPLESVRARIEAAGGEAVVEALDVSSNEDVVAVVGRITERYGRIDIGVFSAGINVRDRNWPVITPELWDQVIGIDLSGAFYCCSAVLPIMRKQGGGLVINVSSMAAKGVSPLTGPAYTSAKHAMNAMTASLLVEERNHGIRATAICPGEVATPILDARPVPVSDEDKARILQSEDLGDLILFVAQQPPHVTLNEILITPTYNRFAAS
jgi:NAD(P)-dependent dehydrogenase (short-subunit alcohol dehydrogenase family)